MAKNFGKVINKSFEKWMRNDFFFNFYYSTVAVNSLGRQFGF